MSNKIKTAINIYGYKGCFVNVFIYINTLLFYKNARLIRLPIEIRGKKFIDFGRKLTTGKNCRIEVTVREIDYSKKKKIIEFGDNIVMNNSVHIGAKYSIKIGNNVLIASNVFISDHNHGNYSDPEIHSSPLTPPNKRPLFGKAVNIEDDVWIGEFTAILPGVNIGKGSIIGSMSVVTKSIPAYCIAVGTPARVIKKYNFETQKWEKVI